MTIEEFEQTKFYKGMKFRTRSGIKNLMGVDFESSMLAFIIEIRYTPEGEPIYIFDWKRCEDCELIKEVKE